MKKNKGQKQRLRIKIRTKATDARSAVVQLSKGSKGA